MSTTGKPKNMPNHGRNQTNTFEMNPITLLSLDINLEHSQ